MDGSSISNRNLNTRFVHLSKLLGTVTTTTKYATIEVRMRRVQIAAALSPTGCTWLWRSAVIHRKAARMSGINVNSQNPKRSYALYVLLMRICFRAPSHLTVASGKAWNECVWSALHFDLNQSCVQDLSGFLWLLAHAPKMPAATPFSDPNQKSTARRSTRNWCLVMTETC